jgi:succinoglycan biosynthesis transport protein ExoP
MRESQENRSLLDHAREVCARRWGLALSVFLLVLGVAAGLAAGLPSLYRATATLLVEPQQREGAGEMGSRIQGIEEEILSRARLEELIDRYRLYADLRRTQPPEAVVEKMRHDVRVETHGPEVTEGRSITFFNVSYEGRDPEATATVANALADLFIDGDSRTRDRSASGTVGTLERQLELTKARLTQQERQYGSLLAQQSAAQQTGAAEANLSKLNEHLRAVSETRERANERRASLLREIAEATSKDPLAETNPTTARIRALKKELADLRQRFKDSYPDVVHLNAQIAELERAEVKSESPPKTEFKQAQLGPLNEALVEVDAEIESLKEEEDNLRRDLSETRRRIDTAPPYHAVHPPIEKARDYETTKALYGALLKQLEEARIAAGDSVRSPSFRILDKAVVPRVPAAPSRPRLMVIGFVLALLMAGAAVVLAEQLDPTFHSVDDIRGFTRVPVLGRIPDMPSPAEGSRRRFHSWVLATLCLAGVLLAAEISYGVARSQERLTMLVSRGHS